MADVQAVYRSMDRLCEVARSEADNYNETRDPVILESLEQHMELLYRQFPMQTIAILVALELRLSVYAVFARSWIIQSSVLNVETYLYHKELWVDHVVASPKNNWNI